MKCFGMMLTKEKKIAFLEGELYGLWRFAWWKDGTQMLGNCGHRFADAERDILRKIEAVEKGEL
jgi:hypothetical protein